MKINKTIKTLTLSAMLTMAALPVLSQDLIARITPVDKKSRTLDTLSLQSTIMRESLESPASDLYVDWDTRDTHYKSSSLPETNNKAFEGAMAMFGAALSIAAAQTAEQEQK